MDARICSWGTKNSCLPSLRHRRCGATRNLPSTGTGTTVACSFWSSYPVFRLTKQNRMAKGLFDYPLQVFYADIKACRPRLLSAVRVRPSARPLGSSSLGRGVRSRSRVPTSARTVGQSIHNFHMHPTSRLLYHIEEDRTRLVVPSRLVGSSAPLTNPGHSRLGSRAIPSS